MHGKEHTRRLTLTFLPASQKRVARERSDGLGVCDLVHGRLGQHRGWYAIRIKERTYGEQQKCNLRLLCRPPERNLPCRKHRIVVLVRLAALQQFEPALVVQLQVLSETHARLLRERGGLFEGQRQTAQSPG